MKNLRYMLIAACSACLLLPLGSCMDTDMNRNKYEVDSEEIGRETTTSAPLSEACKA